MKFKSGDKVRIVSVSPYNSKGYTSSKHQFIGTETVIMSIFHEDSSYPYHLSGVYTGNAGYEDWSDQELELVEHKSNKTKMNLKEKFSLLLTGEPQKSFRKAGITNADDMLTEEGKTVFLSWLLNTKYGDEFKKDVVDELLKDETN